MSTQWIEDAESKIYSKVKAKTIAELKKTYPDINFTMEDNVNDITKFPSVYMFFDFVEQGKTLDIGGINAVLMTVQTRVSVTSAQGITVAKKVNVKVRDALNELGFSTGGSPIPTTRNDTKQINSRYSRTIGYNDSI